MERPIRTQKYYELLLLLPESPHLSSIVPTYQEAQNLLLLVAEIVAELAQVIPDCALIIGDDHSQDGTVTVYQILRAKDFLIWLVIHTHTRGLACAVIEGCAYARAPILLVLDVDLCRPAMAILQLYHAICDGAECAIGARYVSGDETDEPWNWSRWLNSKVARLLAQSLVFLHAPLAGFFTLQRCLPLTPSGYRIAPEMLIKSRATNLREIPGVLRTRRCGESTLTLTQPRERVGIQGLGK